MDIRLLGPVEIVTEDVAWPAGPPQRRCLLALLAVHAGHHLTTESIIGRLWGDHAPMAARRAVHAHLTRLRRALAEAGSGRSGVELIGRSGGYLLQMDRQLVDLHRFRHLVGLARRDDCPDARRVELLGMALGLFRGEPLAGLTGVWVDGAREGWRREQVDAMTAWANAQLRIDSAEQVIVPVTAMLSDNPLDEPLAAILVRALHACGQTAEALRCFADTRSRLADELGADPGPELAEAHLAVLRAQPERPSRRGQPATRADEKPAQLPAAVSAFTGRAAELAQLDALLSGTASDKGAPAAVVISAVSGTAGVGKTALAVQWAHQTADQFPDGQLYVNLRGYDPGQPVSAGDALIRFLTALGMPDADVPVDVDQRAARYRTHLAGRRMLILLDNAASVEQVRPLLPGTGSCAVVVTSRDSLAGLVARDGAHRIELDLLDMPDAIALLRRLVGERVYGEPEAATALVRRCVRLPLAIRVAAELVASRPDTPLAELVTELGDQRRLVLLDAGGDPRTAVAAVFSWSLRHLPAAVVGGFARLGLHPGADFDGYAAAALTGAGLDEARQTLDRLVRAHLIQPAGPGRYGMHDLLRAYAADLAATDGAAGGAHAALGRLVDYYVAAAAAAMATLFPAEAHHRPSVGPASTPTPALTTPTAASAWLDQELPNMVAITAYTAGHERVAQTIQLSRILMRYLISAGHLTDAVAIYGLASRAARSVADRAGEAHALLGLGMTQVRLSRYEAGALNLRRSLALFCREADLSGQARVLTNLGILARTQGDYEAAVDWHSRAVTLFRHVGDTAGEGGSLCNLGVVERLMGRYEQAITHHHQAMDAFRRAGDRYGQALALDNLGVVEQSRGQYAAAATHHRQSLALFRRLKSPRIEGWVLIHLGVAHARLGEVDRAVRLNRQALALVRDMGYQEGECWALNGLGEAAHIAGLHADALAHHTAAAEIAAAIGIRDQRARAHTGLGHAHHALGNRGVAVDHYRQALILYTDLGSPQAEEISGQLDLLDGERSAFRGNETPS